MVLARTVLGRTRAWPVRADLRDLPATLTDLTGRRYVSLVPTQLSRARREDRVWEALGAFDAVLVGGGRTEAGLLADARASGIRVVPTYGMSETCGGCVYAGRPLDGVDVVLADGGQILIGGKVLFSGYRLRPELTQASLVDGRLATADRGRWTDGRLEVLGRRDDVVITGGLNVDLAAVEGLVRGWAERSGAEAVVVGIPDPEWGTKIVAVTDGRGELADLQQVVRRSLPAYAAPRVLVCLKRLPRLASGKPDRRAIRALVTREHGIAGARPMTDLVAWPTPGQWVAGARPRTLPAAIAPVVAGTGLAFFAGAFRPVAALLALVVSLALQVGVNYANDYSDGIRGTDAERVGPLRLVGSGLAAPAAVKRAALASFAVAGLAGLGLVVLTGQWWLLAVGAACVLAAWFYTGGRHPYGYLRAGRGLRVRLLRPGRGQRHRVRAGRPGRLGHAADRRGDRCAGLRDPGGQQPARHRRGHPRRQAHPGHPAGTAGYPAPLRRAGRPGRGGHRRGGRADLALGAARARSACCCWSRPCGRCCPAGRVRRWSEC